MPAVRVNGRTYEEVAVVTRPGAPLPVFTGLQIPAHDYVSLSYTGGDLTGATYKTGGAAGVTVATLVLAYDPVTGELTSITKS